MKHVGVICISNSVVHKETSVWKNISDKGKQQMTVSTFYDNISITKPLIAAKDINPAL